MRRSTAFPGMGRDPAARSRVLAVVPEGAVIGDACEVPSAKCGDQMREGLGARTPRSPHVALRARVSRTQRRRPLVGSQGLQHERDVLVERGAELLHALGDVLAVHPFGEALVLELLL